MITWPVCEQVTVRVILPTPHVGAVEQLPHAETFLHRSDLLVSRAITEQVHRNTALVAESAPRIAKLLWSTGSIADCNDFGLRRRA